MQVASTVLEIQVEGCFPLGCGLCDETRKNEVCAPVIQVCYTVRRPDTVYIRSYHINFEKMAVNCFRGGNFILKVSPFESGQQTSEVLQLIWWYCKESWGGGVSSKYVVRYDSITGPHDC